MAPCVITTGRTEEVVDSRHAYEIQLSGGPYGRVFELTARRAAPKQAAIGASVGKLHFHPKASVRTPPINCPMDAPTPTDAVMIPSDGATLSGREQISDEPYDRGNVASPKP